MKRSIFVILAVITIFMCASCGKSELPTVTPCETTAPSEQTENKITADKLKEYTIVYPSMYNEYRMKDVYGLRTAIASFCGADINVISDKKESDGKKIILASASTYYFCRDKVDSFRGTLDYVIAVDELTDDIILGGANYYADVRAINMFCEKYLNDEALAEISDIKEVSTNKNTVALTACMLGSAPFLEYGCFCDMVKAGFNTLLIDASLYTAEQMHELVKWCAMDNVDIVIRSILHTNIYFDSPNVKGHLIVDEPYGDEAYDYYTKQCEEYIEEYGELSWQPYINIIAQDSVIASLKRSTELFNAVEKVAFKIDVDDIREMVQIYSDILNYSLSAEKKFLAGINVDMQLDGYTQREMMRLMSYVGVCFGANGVEYFNYAGAEDCEYGTMVDNNFNKTDAWHYAVEINYETSNIGQVLDDYEYIGSFMLYESNQAYIYGEYMYNDLFKNTVRIVYDDNKSRNILAGAFQNADSGKTAYTILNLAANNENSKVELYASTENTIIWVDGNIINVDSDVTESLKIELNGTECVIIEVFDEKNGEGANN